MGAQALPLPTLTHVDTPLEALTDLALASACGIFIAFTGRHGGVSAPPFDSLNVSGQVGDDPESVKTNRRLLQEALGRSEDPLVIPHQVHGTDYLVIGANDRDYAVTIEPETLDYDAVVVEAPRVEAMLCFADCVPVIIVCPSGRFAVVHAGWRGVYNSIAPGVVRYLSQSEDPATFNVYIGPHIGSECFECDETVHQNFVERFGQACAFDQRHIDLSRALITDLQSLGIELSRIADSGLCTVCEPSSYFSYRGAQGRCGRQAALAWREDR